MSFSTEAKKPKGGAIGRRGVMQPSLGADLLEQILAPANIRRAFNTLLRLSPQFHSLVPDGVFYQDDGGAMALAELPPPTDAEVTRIIQRCAVRIERLFESTPSASRKALKQACSKSLRCNLIRRRA
jgi:hypothetical protein